MKKMHKGILSLVMALALAAAAFGGFAVTAQAAGWKNMKLVKEKQPQKAYYTNTKAKQIRLTMNAGGKTGSFTFTKKKIKSDITKLKKAMKTGLAKNPGKKGKFTYKSGKLSVTLQIRKKAGTFTAKNGKKKLFSRSFSYTKKKNDVYVLKNATGGSKMTLMLYTVKNGYSFRLNKGNSVSWKKNQIARFGLSNSGKKIVAQSLLPYFTIEKAQYK